MQHANALKSGRLTMLVSTLSCCGRCSITAAVNQAVMQHAVQLAKLAMSYDAGTTLPQCGIAIN